MAVWSAHLKLAHNDVRVSHNQEGGGGGFIHLGIPLQSPVRLHAEMTPPTLRVHNQHTPQTWAKARVRARTSLWFGKRAKGSSVLM